MTRRDAGFAERGLMNRRLQPRAIVLLAVTLSVVLAAAVLFGTRSPGGDRIATPAGRQSSAPATTANLRTLPEGFDSSDEATKPAPSRKLKVDAGAGKTRTTPPRTVAVVFTRPITASELRQAEKQYGFRVVERIPQIGWTVIEPTARSTSAVELARSLAEAGIAQDRRALIARAIRLRRPPILATPSSGASPTPASRAVPPVPT